MAAAVAGAAAWAPHAASKGRPVSWRELRYEGVVAQSDWYTCGPAAAATLLHHYFGIPATEEEMLELALGAMADGGQNPGAGIHAAALVRSLTEKGLPVRGYRVEPGSLAAYFRQGGLPVIVHVTRPEPHYVVAVGLVGDWVLLADPSWGRRLVRWDELAEEKGYSGVALVPLPQTELAARARALQEEALSWAAGRLAQLRRRGGSWR
ncbi:MAG: hypothetical protein BAA04_03015 [Firmicutes bacterium ZCTH02-B6]|nr:MAG: hypothetical protein BAA04_03015 [Firmicutes bacterium ZCTH02-B6]